MEKTAKNLFFNNPVCPFFFKPTNFGKFKFLLPEKKNPALFFCFLINNKLGRGKIFLETQKKKKKKRKRGDYISTKKKLWGENANHKTKRV